MRSTPSPERTTTVRLPFTDTPLPGVDPAWSTTVSVPTTAVVEPVPGR